MKMIPNDFRRHYDDSIERYQSKLYTEEYFVDVFDETFENGFFFATFSCIADESKGQRPQRENPDTHCRLVNASSKSFFSSIGKSIFLMVLR